MILWVSPCILYNRVLNTHKWKGKCRENAYYMRTLLIINKCSLDNISNDKNFVGLNYHRYRSERVKPFVVFRAGQRQSNFHRKTTPTPDNRCSTTDTRQRDTRTLNDNDEQQTITTTTSHTEQSATRNWEPISFTDNRWRNPTIHSCIDMRAYALAWIYKIVHILFATLVLEPDNDTRPLTYF